MFLELSFILCLGHSGQTERIGRYEMKKIYRKIAVLLIGGMVIGSAGNVQAAQVQNGAVYEVTSNQIEGWPQAPEIASETGIVMDADTGAIIYNKGMDEIRYPASITKIMTCLLALEHANLEDKVTFTQTVLSDPNAGGTNIQMQAGEVLTMKQCLDALMVQSANDVATQIAEYVGNGSVQDFVDMMNQKAQELGCTNTHFANASGMPDENHYTTAHDMALIFREAIKNETFRQIIAQQSVVIGPTNMNSEKRIYSCHHALVAQSAPEYYEGCFGGKTGVTEASKNTLVSGVTKNGMTLIAVTLRAEVEQIYQDQIKLFDYAFESFRRVDVPGGAVTVPNGKSVDELVVQSATVGTETLQDYFYNGTYFLGSGVKEEPIQDPGVLQAEEPTVTVTPEAPAEQEAEKKAAEQKQKQVYRYITYILIGLITLSVITAVVSGILKSKKKKKKKKKKTGKR